MAFFRYPGGKSKLKKSILSHLNTYSYMREFEYREPFFGGGSIGLEYILSNNWRDVWINDKDIALSALWTSVIQYPDELKALVSGFTPTVEAFDQFKYDLTHITDTYDVVYTGFKKLAIHQISYSGLGTKSGGPLGGRDQVSKYPIDCRWSPKYICGKIDAIHKRLSYSNIRYGECTSTDFMPLIQQEGDAILYLDPPYYVKGNDLYQFGFTEDDHFRLASALKDTSHMWLLSYDDCPEVRDLYSWAEIEPVNVNYSITATKDVESGNRSSRKRVELLIYPKYHKERLNVNSVLFAVR